MDYIVDLINNQLNRGGSGRGRNQSCQFSWKSVQGFRS